MAFSKHNIIGGIEIKAFSLKIMGDEDMRSAPQNDFHKISHNIRIDQC